MYDIQIIVPCIKERLKVFQNFGLHNIQDTKVLVYCLVNDKSNFIGGWPKDVDVEIIEFKSDDAGHKVYKFLSNFTIDQAKNAKWTLKIDDDSFNDIYNMNKFLNEFYDHERDYYLVEEIRKENDDIELDILREMNLLDRQRIINWQHEIEGCALSRSAMEKIIQNNLCVELFKKKSSKLRAGWTDQCLGLAASFCKIYPITTRLFISTGRDYDLKFIFFDFEKRLQHGKGFVHFHPLNANAIEIEEMNFLINKVRNKWKDKKKKNIKL